jgi:hypothetical protein
VAIARACRQAGGDVQLVTRIGDDGAGDALVLALSRDGIGHAAVLRDAGHATRLASTPRGVAGFESMDEDDTLAGSVDAADVGATADDRGTERPADPASPDLRAADVELALRYLVDASVIVVGDRLADDAVLALSAGASYAGAAVVVVTEQGAPPEPGIAGATVLEAPSDDSGHAFATLVGRYAAALDRGLPPGEAFAGAAAAAGWEPAEA